MLFRQLFDRESCTYTYILADEETKEAVVIDPVIEHVDRDKKIIDELGLKLVFAINTHVHADHITGSGKLKQYFSCQSVLGQAGNEEAKADWKVSEGEVIKVGNSIFLEPRHTPGHTAGCHTYLLRRTADTADNSKENVVAVFTGDTVLIRGCGRTDFQSGSSDKLYESVHSKIFNLPDETKIYPAHDYKGFLMSTVGEEKKHNARLTKSKAEFKEIMANLNLAYPKKIDISLPANLVCGLQN